MRTATKKRAQGEWKADQLLVRRVAGGGIVCVVATDGIDMNEALATAKHIAAYSPGSEEVKEVDQKNYNEIVLALAHAQKLFDAAWNIYLDKLSPLDDARFWEICEQFVKEVWDYRFECKRTDGVKDACRELMRKALVAEDNGAECPYTLEEAFRFAKTYGDIKSRLSERYWNTVEGLSDDSYNDLMDSLPLVGPDCLTMTVMGTHDLCWQILRHFRGKMRKMGEFIAHGENYVEMFLGDNAKAYWRSHLLSELRKSQDNVPDVMFPDD